MSTTVIEGILHKLEDCPHIKLVGDHLQRIHRSKKKTDGDKKDSANRWLKWANGKKELKIVTSDVHVAILPKGRKAKLHDVKVFSRHGPDDTIYDNNKDIRDKVARGNCFLEILAGPEGGVRCVTYALKKFTGGLGDDDDKDKGDDHTWQSYFSKPLKETHSVVCMQKANGEAAHFSARKLEGKTMLFIGSKNVHMVLSERAHIQWYNNPRYQIAREICEAFFDLLEFMDVDERHRLFEFLCDTEYTGVFEILNPAHQHVESFVGMTRPELRFITWTSSDLEPPIHTQLCSLPPHVAIEIARGLCLPTVDYKIIPFGEVEDHMKEIRQGYGYEGEVLYFLDDQHAVIGMLKKKTIWYILCRAIREKLRRAVQQNVKDPAGFNMDKSVVQVEKRMKDIKSWLGLDDATTEAWMTLGVGCLKWAVEEQNNNKLSMEDIADLFPVTWLRYLEDTGQTDRVDAVWTEPSGADA